MKEKTSDSNKLYKIISFPEKIGVLFLVLCIILTFVIDATIALFAIPKVDYSYEPDYTETKFYDWINPYIRSVTGYHKNNDGEVYSSMTVTFCYFGKDSAHKATNTIGSFTVVDDNDEVYYVGDLAPSTSSSYSATCCPLSRLSTTLEGIKRFYGKVEYDKVMNGVNQGSDIIYFREDVIQLDSKKLNEIEYSDISVFENIIKNYNITTDVAEEETTIKSRIDLYSGVEEEYHMDYQLFGVDQKGKTYDLIGYYNFAKNYSLILNHDTTIPNELKFEYYVAVFKISIQNGEERTIYIKKNIE